MTHIIGPIAFQGALGANSDMACRAVFPGVETLPCIAFEDVFPVFVSAIMSLSFDTRTPGYHAGEPSSA